MSSTLTFTQGLLIGQLSVVLLIGAFIKFFIFGEAQSSPSRKSNRHTRHARTPSLHSLASSKSSPPQSVRDKSSASNVLRAVSTNATNIESILRKTYYQVHPKTQGRSHSTHQPESLDWFNVLIAQTIAQYRQTAYNLRDGNPNGPPSILTSLETAINNPDKRPSFIGDIKITEISIGEEYPIFSNVRIVAVDDDASATTGGRLQALVDVDLSDDNLTLAVETSLILNYPSPFSAVLPVALAVSVVRFSGTLSISFVPATQEPITNPDGTTTTVTTSTGSGKPKTNLAFSFLPDYRLDLSVRSLIGSRSRLQDVPKIAQLVEARVQAWFEERVVEPRVQVVPLPGLWPRMGKVRVREGQEDENTTTTTGGSNRAMSQDGADSSNSAAGGISHGGSSGGGRVSFTRKSDHFPSQEETEKVFEGLRYRAAQHKARSNSQVIIADDDMRMPGSLPV